MRKKTTHKNASDSRGMWPVAYRWVAVGTLVAYSAVGWKTVHVAHAQELTHSASANGPLLDSQDSPPVYTFEIPAGPLESVAAEFERITGIAVSLGNASFRTVPSPGATGTLSAGVVLERILSGTGLAYRFTSARAVAIDLKGIYSTVEVNANIDPLSTASPKYAQLPLETPQTITAVSQAVMQEQGVTTLRDALRNVAGISLAAGEGGAQGDNLTIRGFTARNDLFIDGMRDFGSYYRDPFNTQEVEVLQGPSSVTFGRGSTGGVVEQSSKAPGLGKSVSGDLTFGTDLTRRATVDINEPLHRLGNGAAFRLNIMGDEGNVAGRDIAENRRFGIAPSLALGLGTPTRWTFSYFHQNADDNPDYGVPWLFNGPAPVARNDYYGFQRGNYLRTYDDIGTAKVEHDINSHVSIREQVRFANYKRDALITEAQIPAGVTLATPLSSIQVTRHEIGVDSVESLLDQQLDLSAHFQTGSIRHDLVAGIEGGRETSDPTRPTWTNVPTTSLLNPDPYQTFAGTATITSNVQTTSLTAAAYVLDTMKFGRHWDLSGGMRFDSFHTDYSQSVAPASSFHRVDEMPSWRAAAVYKPIDNGSFYFDAGTSFNPSAESLSLSASTASLPPEKNRTYEVGTKWDFPGKHLSLRAAVFQTTKLNAREPDPTNSLLNVLAGTQRVNGLQLEARARVVSRWDLMAGYADLDGRVISSNYYPASVGAQLANVPRHTLNLWNTFHLPGRLEAGVGSNFLSSRTASSTAPFDPITGLVKQVPGYWVFSAMASRPITEHLALQVNVGNIANRYYYDGLHPAHIVLGAGRSAMVGLKFKF
jgi:catecholate siderophore receptor